MDLNILQGRLDTLSHSDSGKQLLADTLAEAACHDLAAVNFLIDGGVDVEKGRYKCCTPLTSAAMCGQETILKFLVSAGADVNAKDDLGGTALMRAAGYADGASMNDRTEIVRFLISEGADVNAKDEYGRTALIYAAITGATEIARLLIEAEADIRNETGLDKTDGKENNETPLKMAESMGHNDIVLLLKHAISHPPKTREARIDAVAHNGLPIELQSAPMPKIKKQPFAPSTKQP